VLSRDKVIPDPDGFARALVHGSPLIDEVRARGGVDPERVVAAVTAALPAAFGADPMRLHLQAIVFEARHR
jgi:hypothetical protein